MRYWWVNQNQTFRQEISGGYLWSPKRNSNGARNPGQLVFGTGEDDHGWGPQGHAGLIMDNLITEGRAKPFIIVMSNSYLVTGGAARPDGEALLALAAALHPLPNPERPVVVDRRADPAVRDGYSS